MALPLDFWKTFNAERIAVRDLRLNVVHGGQGPPVLLVPGWPQTWYAWRHVMTLLASRRSVIAVEPRGMGDSDKPSDGYDLATVARDLVSLPGALGNRGSFDLVGHDIGAWIAHAMAADFPTHIAHVALIDSMIPGVSPSPSAIEPAAINNRVWHFGFNRLGAELNEALVSGNEDLFFSWQFRTKAAHPNAISDDDIAIYVKAYSTPDALRAGFDYYRAIETNVAQNARRMKTKLAMPVLLVAGEKGVGQAMIGGLTGIGANVTSQILPGVGHYVPDEAPQALVDCLSRFLI
ncbi:MAG: alpha/beta hydrolase [Xanthobacteraceae bacterium]